MDEIFKMYMNVNLEEVNYNLYRFQRIPVMIYEQDAQVKNMQKIRDEALGDDQIKGSGDAGNTQDTNFLDYTNANAEIKNEFLSGYYVIAEISYIYTKGKKITQSLKLLRREWPIPAESKNN